MERRALFAGMVAAAPLLAGASARDAIGPHSDRATAWSSLRDYGAVGDGVADDSEAMQAALNACSDGRLLIVPQGKFRIRRPLLAKGLINLAGFSAEASELVFEDHAALEYEGDATNDYDASQITLRSLGFRCAKVRARDRSAVLSLRFHGGSGGTTRSAIVEDVEITAAADGGGFDCALRLVSARNLKIDGLRIRGDRDARGNSIGIDIGGEDAPVDSYITKVSGYFLNRGISINGTVEGVYISQSVFVAVDHGIYARMPHPRPLLFVENCHINAFVSCIDLGNIVQFDLSHNLLYASKPRKPLAAEIAKTGFVAISVAMHEDIGLTSRISGNTIIGTTPIDIPKNGIYVDGENAEFSLSVDNNELVGWDTGVILGLGSRGVVVASSNRFRSNRDAVLDMSGRNIVASESATPNGYVRDDSGLETKWGTSLVSFDAAGKGQLAYAPPFKSKFLFGLCTNADAATAGRVFVIVDDANSTQAEMRFEASPPPGAAAVRIQWLAIGN